MNHMQAGSDTELLSPAPSCEDAHPPLKTRQSKSRGRIVVVAPAAANPVRPGTVVMESRACASVVSEASLENTCHRCLERLKGKVIR